MLKLTNLSINLNDTPIVKNVSLEMQPGSVHAIMGPNGSGKSTLAQTIMGHPHYTVTGGSICVGDTDVTHCTPDERARNGLFLAFQQPIALPGVSVITFLKEAHYAVTGQHTDVAVFTKQVHQYLELVGLSASFANRAVHDGFSGGEKKRLELVQLLLLQPRVAILDELDSGLDIDGLKLVAQVLADARTANSQMAILLITHYSRMLEYLVPDQVHLLCDGIMVASGDAQLVTQLEARGYDAYKQTAQ